MIRILIGANEGSRYMAGFVVMDITQEDYDERIRNKVIDEFANQLKKKYEHCVVNDILMNNDVMSYTNSCSVFESFIDEIAEEMRGAING